MAFQFEIRTRVVFGDGRFADLGGLARELGFLRTLLVADRGMLSAGYVDQAVGQLAGAGIEAVPFHDFDANPDTAMVEAGRAVAAKRGVDSLIGLGGGSSLDCAKGINFVLTNGGNMRDYLGFGKAPKPLLPMIAVPTTAGTGSEAQSYALISDAETHVKMACGDPKAAFRIAILDPRLTVSQPFAVTAATGYDAISHAVESFVTTKRTPLSQCFARDAWQMLSENFERVLTDPEDVEARGAMLLGAHLAGIAIENSMLGATHACANPLTAHYGTPHGVAIAVLLPKVVSWNLETKLYGELGGEDLPAHLMRLRRAAKLPESLSELKVKQDVLPMLAEEAAAQWTGRFNPRPFDAKSAQAIYAAAL